MKKILFCLIAFAAITVLLLPAGKAYAWCVKWDDFSSPVLDLSKWDVENNNDCYSYEIVGEKLKVTKVKSPCVDNNDRFNITPKVSRQVKSMTAEVTVLKGTECHRARIIVDPVMTCKEPGHFQLVLREPIWDPCNYWRHCPDPGLTRYIVFDADVSPFDGLFRREAFFGPEIGPWPPEQIIGKPYILSLRVANNQIIARIRDKWRSLGTIRYTPPGGIKRDGHVLGLGCFGPEAPQAEVLFDNVYLCF